MLTFKDLRTQALALLDQSSDLGTGDQGETIVANAIASAHEQRLLSQRWNFMLWGDPISVQFQTGIRNYTLHPLAAMVTDFTNDTAKQRMVETPTRARFKIGVQDDRYHFEFIQDSPVKVPFTQGILTITGNATISYVDVNGNPQLESLSNSPTSFGVDTVYGVTKNDANPLTITDSNGLVILSLSGSTYGIRYPQIRLFDNGQAETGLYRFYRKPILLSNDNDIPEIPYPFSRILIYDALIEIATYNDAQPPAYWLSQQAKWEQLLNQAYQEGEMEGAEGRTVVEADQYEG